MVRRFGTYLLSGVVATTFGCAKPYQPGASRISEPQEFDHRFSSMPHVAVDDAPMAAFRLSSEERQELEKAREEFNKARDERVRRLIDQRTGGRNGLLGMTIECVFYTFVVYSPICIVLVPFAFGMNTAVESGKASGSQPYMPALPADKELQAAHEKILSHVSATGIAYRLGDSPADPEGNGAGQYPLLVITPSRVTFTADRYFVIKFVAQAHPSEDVSWPPTEHAYQLGYFQNRRRLMSELSHGEARLAESISTTYGLWAYGGPERLATADSHDCGPLDAHAGTKYQRPDGGRAVIVRVLGQSPRCAAGWPMAVEIQPAYGL